jgi:uncharacterized spore protein YtfJ
MDIQQFLQDVAERVGTHASAKSVYGDPVSSGDCTVIPVAEVRYAFGGGGGRSRKNEDSEGGGGGGRVHVHPTGAIEITPQGARYISFDNAPRLAAAIALGFALGMAVARFVNAGRTLPEA